MRRSKLRYRCSSLTSLYHLVGPLEHALLDGEADLCGRESRSTTARGSFTAALFCLSTHKSFYDPHEPGI
jgi:hypothetical protein